MQRECSVLDSPHTLTGFSADPVPEVPPGVDLLHELSSTHSADVYPERIRDELCNTPKSTLEVLTPRGLPSTQVRQVEPKLLPEWEMVAITVLVAGHTKCLTETEV